MLKLLFQLAFRNLIRNPRRSLLTLGAIVVGLWSSLTLSTLARGISQGLLEDTVKNLTAHVQIHHPLYLNDPGVQNSLEREEVEQVINSLSPHLQSWAPRVRVPGVIVSERDSYPLTLIGVDPEREAAISFFGDGVSEGATLTSVETDGIVLGRKLLTLLRTEIGKRIVVMSQSVEGDIVDRGFRVLGVFDSELEATERAYGFVSINTANEMLGLKGQLSEAALILKPESDPKAVAKLASEKFKQLDIKDWATLEPFALAIREIQGRFLVFWFLIVVVAISVGLINTLFMSLFERIREVGLMQALGMPPWLILLEIIFESGLLLCAGALIANLVALLSVWYLSDGIDISSFAAGASFVGIRQIVFPQILLSDWIVGNTMIIVLGLIGSIYPAWRGTKIIPARALQRT